MAALIRMKITLRDIKPAVWRRIEVPAHFNLAGLHTVIQGAMGWHTTHLHCFEIDGARYDIPDGDDFDWGMPHHDERKTKLSKVLKEGTSFTYLYDFGDDWYHDVSVERIETVKGAVNDDLEPRCLDGARACPPEDCGGPYGYSDLLAVLRDKKHPQHADAVEWTGKFDPETFSVPQANCLIYALMALDAERASKTGTGNRRR